MSDLQKVGPDWGSLGSFKPLTAGTSGQQRVSDAHGRFLDAVIGNRCFYLAGAALAGTGYTGGAAGTPLIALHNPANSGKLAVGLLITPALRAAASAAGQTDLEVYTGPSVIPTGTATVPTNALTATAGGSAMKGFVNAALTGSTALNFAMGLATYYWATAASAFFTSGIIDLGGILVAAPGNEIAIGLSTIPTSVTADVAFYWEEIPLQLLG